MDVKYDNEVLALLDMATKLAIDCRHKEVGTGHLLLALCEVRPDSLVVRNLPAGTIDAVRAQLGKGDAEIGCQPKTSARLKRLLEWSCGSAGEEEWPVEYIVCIRGLVNGLVIAARNRDPGEDSTVDCAENVMAQTLPYWQRHYLVALSQYEIDFDEDELLRCCPSKLRFELLLQLLRGQHRRWSYLASILKKQIGRIEHHAEIRAKDQPHTERFFAEAARELDVLQAQKISVQEKLDEINKALSAAAPIAPLEEYRNEKLEVLDEVTSRITKIESRVQDRREKEEGEQSYQLRETEYLNQLRGILRIYNDGLKQAMQKVEQESLDQAIETLKVLAKQ